MLLYNCDDVNLTPCRYAGRTKRRDKRRNMYKRNTGSVNGHRGDKGGRPGNEQIKDTTKKESQRERDIKVINNSL